MRSFDSLGSERKRNNQVILYHNTELGSTRQSPEKFHLYKPQENYILNPKERNKSIIPAKYARD